MKSHDERTFARAGAGECPAIHGGMAGYSLCEPPDGHDGPRRDTEPDGAVRVWSGLHEIASRLPEEGRALTGRYEEP